MRNLNMDHRIDSDKQPQYHPRKRSKQSLQYEPDSDVGFAQEEIGEEDQREKHPSEMRISEVLYTVETSVANPTTRNSPRILTKLQSSIPQHKSSHYRPQTSHNVPYHLALTHGIHAAANVLYYLCRGQPTSRFHHPTTL